jgi:hypothetical protein
MNLAKLSGLGKRNRLLEIWYATSLGSCLEDPTRSLHRLSQLLTQTDGNTARLLAIDIFTGFRSHDRSRCMPAVTGRDQYGIDILSRQQFTHVSKQFAVLIAIVFIDEFLTRISTSRLNVGNRDTLNIA